MMVKGEAPASVQCAALRALGQVLDSIDTVPPSDAKIFNECVPSHPSVLLPLKVPPEACCYAPCTIPALALH